MFIGKIFQKFKKQEEEKAFFIELEHEQYNYILEIFDMLIDGEPLSRDAIKKTFEEFKNNGNDFYNGKKIIKGEEFPFKHNESAKEYIKGELFCFLKDLLRNKSPRIYEEYCDKTGGEIFFIAHIIPRIIRDIDWNKKRKNPNLLRDRNSKSFIRRDKRIQDNEL